MQDDLVILNRQGNLSKLWTTRGQENLMTWKHRDLWSLHHICLQSYTKFCRSDILLHASHIKSPALMLSIYFCWHPAIDATKHTSEPSCICSWNIQTGLGNCWQTLCPPPLLPPSPQSPPTTFVYNMFVKKVLQLGQHRLPVLKQVPELWRASSQQIVDKRVCRASLALALSHSTDRCCSYKILLIQKLSKTWLRRDLCTRNTTSTSLKEKWV